MTSESKTTKLKEAVLGLDQFGSGFSFKLPEGKDTHNTLLGSCFSVLMISTLILYGTMQMQRLAVFEETVVTMSVRESHFDAAIDTISTEDGLNFAFGII